MYNEWPKWENELPPGILEYIEANLRKAKNYLLTSDWKKRNPEKNAEYTRKNRKKNPEKARETYRRNSKTRFSKKENIILRSVRSRLNNIVLNKKLNKTPIQKTISSFEKYFGCSYDYFFEYIKNKFADGMTWQNHGKIWHIDHIIPLSCGKTYEECIALSHYSNLQPLSVKENLSKYNKAPSSDIIKKFIDSINNPLK